MHMTEDRRPLAEHRERAGVTQQQLAGQLDVSVSVVSQWERGLVTPRRPMAQRIDDALGADGEVMRAFGYVSSEPGTMTLEELAARVDELRGRLDAYEARQSPGQGDPTPTSGRRRPRR